MNVTFMTKSSIFFLPKITIIEVVLNIHLYMYESKKFRQHFLSLIYDNIFLICDTRFENFPEIKVDLMMSNI